MDKANFLYVTHAEKEGPFLKVWGQVEKTTAMNVEQALLKTTPHFEQGFSTLGVETLQNGVLCCAKYKDSKYYRARILDTEQLQNGFVEVNFIDFGNRDTVPYTNLRSMQNFTSSFISLQPLANCFLLAEAACPAGEWNDICFQEIVKEIRYTEVNYAIVGQAVKYYCVRLTVNGQDLALNFINRGLMAKTSLHTQEAVLLTMLTRQTVQAPHVATVTVNTSVPPPPIPQQQILTYKAHVLEPGSQQPVYVSYISDGPCHFSVQLKHSEDILVKLMNEINCMPLKPLEDVPLPGTVCVARCVEDGHICRAVVTNEVDSQFKVFYVDFGNSEIVPLEALYQIPFKFVLPKVMAIRFALAGIEKSTVTIEMKCAFKQFVDNRLLLMNVIPVGTRTALPRCELIDPESKTSALDVLHRAAANAYPEPLSLNRGFSQLVLVSYVFSCNRFYVQLKSKESELSQLMSDLQESCQKNDPVSPDMLREGLPCGALFEGDGQWYRSQVVEVYPDDTTKVRYIDYGNEEVVPVTMLKLVEGEQLTVLRPQAIECCLNGYQKMDEDLERDNFLEEIILEKEFTMRVVEMQNSKALVDLIDASNYNVASLLLEKIASARSQVSPMLVQGGNRIEHRKSVTSPTQNFRDFNKDRKPGRDTNKNWNEKSNDSAMWRQDNKDKGFRSRESNDQTNEGNWRQNRNNNNFNQSEQRGFRDQNSSKNTNWRENKGINSRLDDIRGRDHPQASKNLDNQNEEWGGTNDTNVISQSHSVNAFDAEAAWDNTPAATNETAIEDSWGDNTDRNNERRGFKHKDSWSDNKGGDRGGFRNRSDTRGSDKTKGDNWENRSNDGLKGDSNSDSWGNKGKFSGDRGKRERGGGDEWKGRSDRHGDRGFRDGDRKDDWGGKKDDWGGGKDDRGGKRDDWGGKRDDRGGKKDDWGGKKDDWGGKKDDWGGKQDDWGGKKDDWGGKQDDWGDKKDDWGSKGGDRPFKKRRDDDFDHNKENRFDKPKRSWDSEAPRSGGQGFKSNFKRENSELSSSGSERGGFRKGQRSGGYENKGGRSFDKPAKTSGFGGNTEDTWDTGTTSESFDAAPNTAVFNLIEVNLGGEVKVSISWFHDPAHFYVQLSEFEEKLRTMMEDIQQAYKSRRPSTAVVGAPVISIFPEDKVLYRAKVLEVMGSSYKVLYVDFGNVSMVEKVWPIETKFMELPAQALCCGLYGVELINEHWEDAHAYSQYFDKDSFTCKFITNDNGGYLVEMGFGDCLISELLERDMLAKNNNKPEREICLELLKCQQFFATLLSMNSLTDILIQTARGEVFKCSVYNHDKADTTNPQNLQAYLNQSVIVDVHDVVEETLVVTFYEGEYGEKIELVEPDPGAHEFSTTCLNHPVMSTTMYGWVSYIDGDKIYIQPSEYLEDLRILQEDMVKYYENVPEPEFPLIPVELFLYAYKHDDHLWHRVIALQNSTEDEEYVSVQFVDSGKMHTVSVKQLRELEPNFIGIEKLCIPFIIQGYQNPYTELGEGRDVIIKDIQLKKSRGDYWFEALHIEGRGEPLPPMPEPVNEQPQFDESQIYVNISHVDSPTEIYIQKFDEINTINEIQTRLQEEVPSLPTVDNPTAGVLCAAPYSVDEQWYRAEVLDADADITTVRFVDYGNTDVLNNETVKVKTLPSDMLSMAVHATRCSLKVAPVDEEWSPAAIEIVSGLTDRAGVTGKFIDQDEKTTYVELYKDGECIREILITSNLALDCAPSQEEGNTGFVSHINSPSEFFIQLECYSNELERFSEQLSDAENFPELEDFSPGSLCAAMYLDEQWYRARILSNTVAGIEVLFIDFGNSSVSNNLRQLPEDLVVPPPLAQKCSLQKPEGLMYWSPQAVEKFSEIAADGQTIFVVEKLSSGETSTVKLLLDGEDIVNRLLPETVEGHLANVESLDSFDAVINEETREKLRLETPPGLVWTKESHKKFEDICNKGETKFRIEYVSEDTVRLYIDGKDIRSELGGIKQSSFINKSASHVDEASAEIVQDAEELSKSGEEIQSAEEKDLAEAADELNTSFIETSDGGKSDSNTSAKDSTSEGEAPQKPEAAENTAPVQDEDQCIEEPQDKQEVADVGELSDSVKNSIMFTSGETDTGLMKEQDNIPTSCDTDTFAEGKDCAETGDNVVTSTPTKTPMQLPEGSITESFLETHEPSDLLDEGDEKYVTVLTYDSAEKQTDVSDGTKGDKAENIPVCSENAETETTVESSEGIATQPVMCDEQKPEGETPLRTPDLSEELINVEEKNETGSVKSENRAEEFTNDNKEKLEGENLPETPESAPASPYKTPSERSTEDQEKLEFESLPDTPKSPLASACKMPTEQSTYDTENLELESPPEMLESASVSSSRTSENSADEQEKLQGDSRPETLKSAPTSPEKRPSDDGKEKLECGSPAEPEKSTPTSPCKTTPSLQNGIGDVAILPSEVKDSQDGSDLNLDMESILKGMVESALNRSPTKTSKQNYDEKIVPAALSRPQSPLPDSSDGQLSDLQE